MDPAKRHILIILDGYGIAEDPAVSAIAHAKTPYLDTLFARYPHATLQASGRPVGLPPGQMGNSEVGHMNLGAGRIVNQDITRIDLAIEDGSFYQNDVLMQAARHARERGSKLHLLGLLSDGGVHSHTDHLYALLRLARQQGLTRNQVCVHAFTDGRDTDPNGGAQYAKAFEEAAAAIGVGQIVSVVGRYHAMDRDRRWPRIEKAYGGQNTRVEDHDAVVFFNFRADRGRQITAAFLQGMTGASRGVSFETRTYEDLFYATLTPYDKTFGVPVAFDTENLEDTLGAVLADRGGSQLRVAETEKYPHVTYFFSGGREEPFKGEARLLIPSPKVATYDLQPEMSAPEVAQRCAKAIAEERYNFICLNFANPDMVGHTGVFEAAVLAVEAVDAGTRRVVEAAIAHGYSVTILADHGNADRMQNPDGTPHTAHTTSLVPHLIIKDGFEGPVRDGKLGDVAPTILTLMGEDIPTSMTGEVLV